MSRQALAQKLKLIITVATAATKIFMLLIKFNVLFPLKYAIANLAINSDGNISTHEVLSEPNFGRYFRAALGSTTIPRNPSALSSKGAAERTVLYSLVHP